MSFMTASEVMKRYNVNVPQPVVRPHDATTWLKTSHSGAERRLAETRARLEESRARVDDAEALARIAAAEMLAPAVEPEPEPIVVEPEPVVVERVDYSGWTRAELYARARELDVPRRSKMTKAMLRKALERLQGD